MVAVPLEVVDQEVWSHMRAEGIWGPGKKLEASERAVVKRGRVIWVGHKVVGGVIEASVSSQVFCRLRVGLEEWKGGIE